MVHEARGHVDYFRVLWMLVLIEKALSNLAAMLILSHKQLPEFVLLRLENNGPRPLKQLVNECAQLN